jgi:predicted dinucleotide-binding enzyme
MTVPGSTPMTIVIVGSGRVGTALATNLRSLGHTVTVAARTPGDDQIGIDGAAVGADVTILAVPFGAVAEVVPRLGLAAGSVLVDATNPFGQPLPAGATTGASVVVGAAVAGVRVVKAFNVLGAEHMSAPPLPDGHRPLLPVAADDAAARRLVADLATEMGFDAVEVGGLDDAGLLEEAARYWGLLAFTGGLGRSVVLVAHQRPPVADDGHDRGSTRRAVVMSVRPRRPEP